MSSNTNPLEDQFHRFDSSLQAFGFNDSERIKMYKILSGIIYLNMIEFKEEQNTLNAGSVISESSKVAVDRVAELFESNSADIKQMLTKRYLKTRNENIE